MSDEQDEFERILDEAEALTLEQLDSRISSLIRLKDSELSSLFPTKTEKERLVKLMQIVKAATAKNVKREQLIAKIPELADAVIKLLAKLT